jgi:hypothetical protein
VTCSAMLHLQQALCYALLLLAPCLRCNASAQFGVVIAHMPLFHVGSLGWLFLDPVYICTTYRSWHHAYVLSRSVACVEMRLLRPGRESEAGMFLVMRWGLQCSLRPRLSTGCMGCLQKYLVVFSSGNLRCLKTDVGYWRQR